MTMTIEEMLAIANDPVYHPTKTARVLLDHSLIAEHVELEQRLTEATASGDPATQSLAAELVELEAQIDAARQPIKFKCTGHAAWVELLRQHPATSEQRQLDERSGFNVSTFPLAAIAASAVDPVMTVDQVAQLEAVLPVAEFDLLWMAALEVNLGGPPAKSTLAALVIRQQAAVERLVAEAVSDG